MPMAYQHGTEHAGKLAATEQLLLQVSSQQVYLDSLTSLQGCIIQCC